MTYSVSLQHFAYKLGAKEEGKDWAQEFSDRDALLLAIAERLEALVEDVRLLSKGPPLVIEEEKGEALASQDG